MKISNTTDTLNILSFNSTQFCFLENFSFQMAVAVDIVCIVTSNIIGSIINMYFISSMVDMGWLNDWWGVTLVVPNGAAYGCWLHGRDGA